MTTRYVIAATPSTGRQSGTIYMVDRKRFPDMSWWSPVLAAAYVYTNPKRAMTRASAFHHNNTRVLTMEQAAAVQTATPEQLADFESKLKEAKQCSQAG